MAKNLNVRMTIDADTHKAQIQIDQLSAKLRSLTTSSLGGKNGLGISQEIEEAIPKVVELQAMLDSCKTKTGGLDLGKFNQSLKQSSNSLADYADSLSALGPSGKQAFAQLAQSIVTAEVPLKRTNKLLNEFKTTLANTAKWQISSSILHGFMGAVQHAYGYAQDLNKSLNDIRIVTGQTTEQMARFAKEANESARALSTTTTAYTEAALIFYQQGLDDQAVKHRTDTVIKMANVTKDGATEVSSYMTAIWNNFNKAGDESAEHFADVITKLGAATAASSSEIAAGLEKFASVADMIGLSYEYATAAVTTIIDKTRQSEDVVGTSLKTIFARIQGLNLGETLDDGTNLNKYSQALQKVGIDIKDSSGQLKDMDVILDEMGSKWKSLSKDTQVAVAQTVAGVRQYNQLVALMDNWDSMEKNVQLAEMSDGSLEEQAEIYAESWEAARDRVTASLEEIYGQLLDDNFFISITNGFATFVNGIADAIDNLGGLSGVLTIVGSLLLRAFGPAISENIQRIIGNFTNTTEKLMRVREEANKVLSETMDDGTRVGQAQSQAFQQISRVQDEILKKQSEFNDLGKNMSEEQKRQIELYSQMTAELAEAYVNAQKEVDAQEAITNQILRRMTQKTRAKGDDGKEVLTQAKSLGEQQKKYAALNSTVAKFQKELSDIKKISSAEKQAKAFEELKKKVLKVKESLNEAGVELDEMTSKGFDKIANSNGLDDLEENINGVSSSVEDFGGTIENEFEALKTSAADNGMEGLISDIDAVQNSSDAMGQQMAQAASAFGQVSSGADLASEGIKKIKPSADDVLTSMTSLAQGFTTVAMTITSIKGLFETWTAPDMSWGEKLLATMTTVGMMLPMITSALNKQNLAQAMSAATSLLAAMGFSVEGSAAAAASVGVGGLAAVTWAAVWPLLAVVAAIGLLVAAVAGIVAGVKAISDAYNADAIAAQEAAAAAKELQNQYDETKQAYDDMIAHMDKYTGAREKLESLTEGTREYRQALQEANRAALDMLAASDKFTSEDYHWENGELIIDEAAMTRVQDEMAAEEAAAFAASQMANINASRAKAKADATEFKRSSRDEMGIGDADIFWKTAGVSIATSMIPVIGPVLAPLASGVFAGTQASKASDYDNAVDKILTKMEDGNTDILAGNMEEFTRSMNELGIQDGELIQALYDNRDSIEDLGKDLNNIAEQEKLAAQNAAEEIMANSTINNTTEGQMAMEAGGEIYQALYDKALKKYQDIDMANFWGVGTDAGKEMWAEYAKKTGISSKNGYKVTNYRKDGGVDYEYIDENGEKKKASATKEMITQTLAAAEAAGELEESMMELKKEIGELNSSDKGSDQALAGFLSTGDFEGSTKGQFDALKSELSNMTDADGNAVTDLDSQIGWYLDKQFGDGLDGAISDETAQKYGYESAEKMKEAFKKGLEVDFEIPEGIGENIGNQLTLGASKAMSDNLEKMGEEGGQAYLDTIKTLSESIDLDALTPQEQTQMWNEIAAIDSAAWDAGKQYAEVIERYGGSVDMTTDAWKNNIAAMRDAGNAVPNMSQLKADMEAIKAIVDDLDVGGILSVEDYELLVAYNSELAKYFTILSDGSAQLTGDILDFQQETKQINQENLREAVRAQKDLADELNAQYNAGNKAVGGEGKLNQYRDTENYVGDDGKNYYNGNNVENRQIAFLQSQGYDQEKINEWLKDLSDGSTTTAVLEEIAKAVDETATSFEGLDEQAELALAQAQKGMNELALSAEDAAERAKMLESGDINVGAYGKAFEAAHNAEKWEDMDPDEVESYAKALQKAAEKSDLLDNSLASNAEKAEDVALYTKKMNKGIGKLADGFEDWNDILTKSDESSEEYASAMSDMKDAMSDVLGVSEDFLSDSFIKDNLEDIKLAAEGDADAIDRLAIAAGRDIILNIGIEDEGLREEVLALHDGLAAMIPDIKVGATVDDADFLAKAEQIIRDSKMTMEEANAYFRSIGFEPEFTETTIQEPLMGTKTTTSDVQVGSVPIGDGSSGQEFHYIESSVTSTEPYATGKTQDIKVPALSTDGEAPKIKLTRTNAGANNNFSSSNSGGPKADGSKPKEAKKLDKKKVEDPELDRYHVITEQLERLNAELEKISNAKDRAFGSKKLKLMDQEIAKTNEIIKKNEEYAALLKKNRDEEKNKLAALGAEFDENGVITNYNDLIKNNQVDYSEYNSKIDDYNKLSGDEQAALDEKYKAMQDSDGNYYDGYQDYLEDIYAKTAEERQAEFEKLLEQYHSDQEEYEKIMQQIQDDRDANFDREMAKIDYVVEVKLDVDDRDIKHLEFLLEMLEDKDFNAAEAIANIGQQVDNSLSKIDTYKQGINDILGKVGKSYTADDLLNGNVTLDQLAEEGLTEEGLAQLEGYIDGLAEENEALREMRANAWAQVSEEFNEYIEKMDSGIEKIEHLKSITESYKNIVDIVGKKFLGVSNDLLDKMNEATVKQSTDLLEANKAKMEAVQSAYDELLNTDTSGWSDQAKKQREEQLKEMEAELQGAKEAFMSSWEEALQASADRYAAAVDNIISEFEDSIAGLYGTLDELQEAFDRAKDLNSQYVEDYEQIYNLTKLTREINEAMDNTDNLEAKAAYRDYLEEINAELESGKQLSEYDIEYRQKKLELIQAEMALNEAKTAKSSVSMVRGEDGNYSYMYTASDEDVANAEQNYEDKLFEMQQLNGDYINNLEEQIIQTQAECAQALAAIKESDFNSYEEWRAAVDRTQDFYNQKLDFYYSQLDGTLSNNRNLYENDWTRYSEATGYKISSDEQFVDRFNETSYALITGFQTREEAQNAWNIASDQMLVDLATAYTTWQSEIETIMGEAGTSVEGFANTMEEQTDRNVEDSEKAKEAVQEMAEQMQEDFANTISKIVEWETTWGTKVDAVIAKNTALITSYNALKQAMADALGGEDGSGGGGDSGDGDGGSGGGDSGNGGGSGSGGGNAVDNSDKAAGVAAAIWMEGGAGSGWGNDSTRSQRLNEKGVASAQSYINAHGPNGDIYREWSKKRNQLKNFHYGSFDTGGYTGDWGDKSGRLALLHSKEIVLNAEDTKNFLSAIELVREIANIIDLNAAAASGAFGSLSSATSVHGAESEIIQQIEIHAEFPDANNHNEIELAFNNLLNAASQYANRDK